MPKRTWEYTTSHETGHKFLNTMGSVGWEVIYYDWNRGFVVYKRPLVNGAYEYA